LVGIGENLKLSDVNPDFAVRKLLWKELWADAHVYFNPDYARKVLKRGKDIC
jgi:hypothetical protein